MGRGSPLSRFHGSRIWLRSSGGGCLRNVERVRVVRRFYPISKYSRGSTVSFSNGACGIRRVMGILGKLGSGLKEFVFDSLRGSSGRVRPNADRRSNRTSCNDYFRRKVRFRVLRPNSRS